MSIRIIKKDFQCLSSREAEAAVDREDYLMSHHHPGHFHFVHQAKVAGLAALVVQGVIQAVCNPWVMEEVAVVAVSFPAEDNRDGLALEDEERHPAGLGTEDNWIGLPAEFAADHKGSGIPLVAAVDQNHPLSAEPKCRVVPEMIADTVTEHNRPLRGGSDSHQEYQGTSTPDLDPGTFDTEARNPEYSTLNKRGVSPRLEP